MRAKFEDLPLEAHTLIFRNINRHDCFEMRKACSMWRHVLKYEVQIFNDGDGLWDISFDAERGKSLLDFTYLQLMVEIYENKERGRFLPKFKKLLSVFCDKVIHLVTSDRFLLLDHQIFPNMKTIQINDSMIEYDFYSPEPKKVDLNYQLERLHEPPLSYEVANFKNSWNFSEELLLESWGRYLKEITLTEHAETIRIELWQEIISTSNHLQILNLEGIYNLEFIKILATYLPASAPLKTLKILCSENFSDILEIFCQKWAHSMEIIELKSDSEYDKPSIASLKHLRALHTLKLSGSIKLSRFQLYNLIFNNNLQELSLSGMNIDEEEIISILENLPRLRRLSFDYCRPTITDRILATIFRKLTLLKELYFLGSYDLTDAGFLGFGDTPYPISRLRGLTLLVIMSNGNITERILTEIVRLKELRQIGLDVEGLYPKLHKMLNEDCCAQLRKQVQRRARL